MSKVALGPQTLLCPLPAVLIGANVDDKPNFTTIAWCSIANDVPPMISVAMRHLRYTLTGIRQNQAFSVNLPSTDLVREVDYCGITSGSKVDKTKVCQFNVFYGKSTNAPLIEQCPVNLECKVVKILDLDNHSLVIGRIEETYISEICLTDGKPDFDKIKPVIYLTAPAQHYRAFGEVIAKAFSIGRELKSRE